MAESSRAGRKRHAKHTTESSSGSYTVGSYSAESHSSDSRYSAPVDSGARQYAAPVPVLPPLPFEEAQAPEGIPAGIHPWLYFSPDREEAARNKL